MISILIIVIFKFLFSNKDDRDLSFAMIYVLERQKQQKAANDYLAKIMKEHGKITVELEFQRTKLKQEEQELKEREVQNENENEKLKLYHEKKQVI